MINLALETDIKGDKLLELNNKTPKLIMLVGLPASGKSTIAVQLSLLYGAKIHSSDSIREELSGDVNNQDINQQVFDLLHKRIKNDLRIRKSVIWDSTNLSTKKRVSFLKQLKDSKIDCVKYCIVMATSFDICTKLNLERDRTVPLDVMKRMYKSFEVPSHYEGFDEIAFLVKSGEADFDWHKIIVDAKHISHDNPHHSLSIGDHCIKTMDYMREQIQSEHYSRYKMLTTASILHDVGKVKVKSFENSQREITDTAHYYGHQNVSAYDSMFYIKDHFHDIHEYIYVLLLINHHMKPFEWEHNQNPERSIKKFKTIYGDNLYNDLQLLHECDLNAH